MFKNGVHISHVNWAYSFCGICLNNSHEKVQMVRERLVSTYDDVDFSKEYWVCPKCGHNKKF
jgi:hypothetical protein